MNGRPCRDADPGSAGWDQAAPHDGSMPPVRVNYPTFLTWT